MVMKLLWGGEKIQITLQEIKYLNGRSTIIMNQTNYSISNSYVVGSQVGTKNSQLYFDQSDFSSEVNQAIFFKKQ